MEKKKKILMIVPSPLYSEKASSIRSYNTAKILSKKYIIDICSYSIGEDFSLQNTKVYRTPLFYKPNIKVSKFSFKKLLLDFFLFIRSFSLFITRKYDIIHCEDFEGAFIGFLITIFSTKKRVVYNLHNRVTDNLFFKRKKGFLIKFFLFLEKRIIKKADLIIVNWDFYLKDEIFKDKKKVLFYDKINNEIIPFNFPYKDYIVYVGNFREIQGVEDFVKTIKEINLNIKIILIGKTTKEIERLKDDNIILTGPLSIKKANYLIKESLFAILPRLEGAGMKMISYIMQNKIILAKETSHNKDFLINGYNAFTYSNKEELVKKIEMILSEKFNKKNIEKGIEETKKKIINNWNSERFLKEYEY